jgi:hypothetical protein
MRYGNRDMIPIICPQPRNVTSYCSARRKQGRHAGEFEGSMVRRCTVAPLYPPGTNRRTLEPRTLEPSKRSASAIVFGLGTALVRAAGTNQRLCQQRRHVGRERVTDRSRERLQDDQRAFLFAARK